MALTSTPTPAVQRRLQTQPRPLEADHVVNLDKQLFVTSIGHFPDGSELQGKGQVEPNTHIYLHMLTCRLSLLSVSHRHYSKAGFLEKLGESVVKIVEGIPVEVS